MVDVCISVEHSLPIKPIICAYSEHCVISQVAKKRQKQENILIKIILTINRNKGGGGHT